MAMDLDEIAAKEGTDKSTVAPKGLSAKSYTAAYGNYLEPYRNEPITFLEIGIWKGASLRMWEEYLPKARLFAIDIDPKCKSFETARTKVFIGDQTDTAFLADVVRSIGTPIDAIIDDGGHRMEHHQASLQVLWPAVRDGGWYAIEDLHTCYREDYGGGYKAEASTAERILKPAIDALNFDNAPIPFVEGIGAMHVYPSVAFLFKGSREQAVKPKMNWLWSKLRGK